MATTIAWFVYRRPPGERGWGFPSMVVARKYIEFVKKYPGYLLNWPVAHPDRQSRHARIFRKCIYPVLLSRRINQMAILSKAGRTEVEGGGCGRTNGGFPVRTYMAFRLDT